MPSSKTQGSIPAHSDEHLATSDKGVVMLRRLLARQIRVVLEGGAPEGTGQDASQVSVKAGNFFE